MEEVGLGGGGCEIIPSSSTPRVHLVGHVKASGYCHCSCCWLVVLRPIPATPAWRRPRRSSRLFAGAPWRPIILPVASLQCARVPAHARGDHPAVQGYQGTPGKVGDQSSTPTTYISAHISSSSPSHPPKKTLALQPEYQDCAGLSFVFPALLPPSYPSSQHLGTTLFDNPHRMPKRMNLGPLNIS